MFGIIADLIAAVTTILLPAYLSYKSLRTHDPAQTHPWLIYFTILSLTLLFESWALFIIGWIPFYSWFRLFFLLYLVLPQTQGAKILYLNYLEPYIVEHESRIDKFIGETHAQLQGIGLGYLNVVIEYFRDKVLGQKSPQPPPPAAGYASYAQDLLSRFAMPSARANAPTQSAGGVYGMVSGIAGAAMSTGRTRDISGSAVHEAALIPDSLVSEHMMGASSAEKSSFISAQRERLGNIMRALDTEQQNLDLAYGTTSGHRPPSSGGLKTKSKSEQSFEKVDYEEAHTPAYSSHDSTPPRPIPQGGKRPTSGSWVPSGVTGWFGGAAGDGAGDARSSKGWNAARDITEAMAQGMSSGVDRQR